MPGGWQYEADPRHGELIVEALVGSGGKGAGNAGVDEEVKSDDPAMLSDRQVTEYRDLTTRGNDLSLDRPDIIFAAKELSRDTAKPTTASWERSKRFARYLRTRPRLILDFPRQKKVDVLDTFTDANWA